MSSYIVATSHSKKIEPYLLILQCVCFITRRKVSPAILCTFSPVRPLFGIELDTESK